jgi:hypothetical protein
MFFPSIHAAANPANFDTTPIFTARVFADLICILKILKVIIA